MELKIPGITDPDTLAVIARATRKFSQYKRAVQNALDGFCPFCNVDRGYNEIVYESVTFFAWFCKPPEKNTRLHFLLVPKRHVKSIWDLTTIEYAELRLIIRILRKEHGFNACGILIRDGDARRLAGTIEHLHIHVMVPDGTGRVESPFFKDPGDDKASLARAIVFEKMRLGETVSMEELKLVEDRMD